MVNENPCIPVNFGISVKAGLAFFRTSVEAVSRLQVLPIPFFSKHSAANVYYFGLLIPKGLRLLFGLSLECLNPIKK